MKRLEGFQKTYLRGLAHSMKAAVYVGQNGMTDAVFKAMEMALTSNELVKVRFIDLKEKGSKEEAVLALEERTDSEMVGMIGHTALFYRQHSDPKKRKVSLPQR